MARQVDTEGSALAHFRFGINVTARLLDDAIDHREAKARALAHFLGGEEGLENLVHDLGRNTRAVIGNFHHHHVFCREFRTAKRCDLFLVDVARPDGDLAAVRHGVARIDAEIDEHLLELRQVGLHRPQITAVIDFQLDIGA